MVQLAFDATQYPPDPLEPDVDNAAAITWDPNPKTQLEYIAACKARQQLIDTANKRWRASIRTMQAAKIEADELRDAWHAIKSTKAPRPPYIDILFGGDELNPDLTHD